MASAIFPWAASPKCRRRASPAILGSRPRNPKAGPRPSPRSSAPAATRVSPREKRRRTAAADRSGAEAGPIVRIVAGKHRGRTLAAPKGRDTRPTAARAREALFNILAHGGLGPNGGPAIEEDTLVLDA